MSTIPPPEDTLILYHRNYAMQELSIQLFFFDKKIKGWYLPSLKNIARKIYLTQISKVLPVPIAKPLTETALTLTYFVLFPGNVTAL